MSAAKYMDFHRCLAERRFTAAGKILASVLGSDMAPKWCDWRYTPSSLILPVFMDVTCGLLKACCCTGSCVVLYRARFAVQLLLDSLPLLEHQEIVFDAHQVGRFELEFISAAWLYPSCPAMRSLPCLAQPCKAWLVLPRSVKPSPTTPHPALPCSLHHFPARSHSIHSALLLVSRNHVLPMLTHVPAACYPDARVAAFPREPAPVASRSRVLPSKTLFSLQY